MTRVVVLAGPSCVGKSPLFEALKREHGELAASLVPLVFYNSRRPRPGEKDGVDYHFRTREEIEELRHKSDFVIIEARRDLQALHISQLPSIMEGGRDAFFEGNPFAARAVLDAARQTGADALSIFVSPLCRSEILAIRSAKGDSLEEIVFKLMREKLLRRRMKQEGKPSEEVLVDIDARAGSARREIAMAHLFDYVIPNHDGEDSDNWDICPVVIGDARRALEAVASLLKGETAPLAERWESGLVTLT